MNKSVKTAAGVMCATAMVMAMSNSVFAEDAMSWAVGTGIITGKDNGTRLDPQGNASRAECAIIIQRFLEKL